MPVRDALAFDFEDAKTEPVVKKGQIKYVRPPPPSRARRTSLLAVAAVLAAVIVVAVIFAYSQRDMRDTLHIKIDKVTFTPGEEVRFTVTLVNPGGKAHSYDLPGSQAFGLEIINGSGDVVAEGSSEVQPGLTSIDIGPGETKSLGTFSWNQTAELANGTNETWAQVPSGDYIIKVFFKGSADIAAEKRITIG